MDISFSDQVLYSDKVDKVQLALIERKIERTSIHQRAIDGYINATAMCKASGKRLNDYLRLSATKEFLRELSSVTGIPATGNGGLVIVIQGGTPELQGTWVHPQVAVNLGQWCSPKFAVAVSQWVHEWISGNIRAELPVHIKRYIMNRSEIPVTHWSMLNEVTLGIVAPLEELGYTLPDHMLPDGSAGKLFSRWLRSKGVDVDSFPMYNHRYPDGRIFPARLYPNKYLAEFKEFFYEEWLINRSQKYFAQRDPNALPYLPKLLPPPKPN